MKGLAYAAAEFPLIDSLFNEIKNDDNSWFNQTKSKSFTNAQASVEQCSSRLLELVGKDKATQETMHIILNELSDARDDVESDLCDMAFISGFKAASKMFSEALK